jgi:UDP-N-acetylglucosamine 2-epimerase (non-hydrolysing)
MLSRNLSDRLKLLFVFGTRPEAIKLAPVITQARSYGSDLASVVVSSGQHTSLLDSLPALLGFEVDYDLAVMQPGQTPSSLCSLILERLDKVLELERPDVVIVQGDTTTALAGGLAAFHRGIPVAHVEAGLRSDNPLSPFPEEMNRRLLGRIATTHFAATESNRCELLREGVQDSTIFITGNTVVDALHSIASTAQPGPGLRQLLRRIEGLKPILLTTHRRESFGDKMSANLRIIKEFVERHEDVALVFPVHPNPSVRHASHSLLGGTPRIHLVEPMAYDQFICLMKHAWLIVSDSGGIQEEAPSLGKPLLIIRENTERPEAVECGIARLVGESGTRLGEMLEEAYLPASWIERVKGVSNPFGDGHAGERIISNLRMMSESRLLQIA